MEYSLFPDIEPFATGQLKVSDLHTIYFEQVGNPNGKPILFIHGGPGGGISPDHRRYYDPNHYRIILVDQRGCGRSTPHAELKGNTTWDLVSDFEKLRNHLQIKDWILFGGSWGSTLALIYAETHPSSVKGLILRGIFLCREHEIKWFYQEGASRIFPELWQEYLAPIPLEERHDMVGAFYQRLTSPVESIRLAAARAWSVWEGSTSRLIPDGDLINTFSQDRFAEAFARIECHYFINKIWLSADNQIIDQASRLRNLPGIIVHGRYDMVCPVENAWDLHRAWPESELHIVPDAGHSARDPGIYKKLVAATEQFKSL